MAEETIQIDPVTGKHIPMKNGKPCRVCVDFKTWSKIEKGKGKAGDSKSTSASPPTPPATPKAAASTATAAAAVEAAATPTDSPQAVTEEWKQKNCPADVETLGRHTWTLLHTMAAYYPEKPESKQKESMKSFFDSFAQQYPCWFCKVR
jgi:FAD-linked sulfhydryl oxidase